MKKFLQIFMLLLAAAVFSQNVTDFGYINVPQKFKDFDQNKYGLNVLLASKLKVKKFIINEDSGVNDPCETLNAEVLNTSNMFTNKVKVEFRDCHNVVISSLEGKSRIKEFEPGMRDALENALKQIGTSNPLKYISAPTKPAETVVQNETPKKVAVVEKEIVAEKPVQKTEVKSTTKTENKAEIYSNGTLNLNKINISESQFILANPNNSVPYAIFSSSSKKDVFRVQLENGTQTFGYLENGNIVVEIPNSDGSFGKEIFLKK